MKFKIFYLLSLTLFIGTIGSAQELDTFSRYLEKIEKQLIRDEPSRKKRNKSFSMKKDRLMTYPALNVFMAKRVNAYLSGSGDLSLNSNYFILEASSGRLFLGHNWAKSPSETNSRTQFVLTTGLKANVANTFATIYTGASNRFADDIGGALKLTWLGRGTIYYDDEKQVQFKKGGPEASDFKSLSPSYSQKEIASFYRTLFREEASANFKENIEAFERNTEKLDPTFRELQRQDFRKKRITYYKNLMITKEADIVYDQQLFNTYWNHWVSLNFYIPFTKKTYNTSPDFLQAVEAKKFYNFEGDIYYNQILETKRLSLFNSLSIGLLVLNNINTSQLKQFSITEYRDLTNGGNLTLASLQRNEVYIGDYESQLTPIIRWQLVGLFLAQKRLGLSFQVEKYFDLFNPLNLKAGIPFNLPGKDKKTKVSFELQFKWNDLNNTLFPDRSISEKLVIGLSVGVPISSKIY